MVRRVEDVDTDDPMAFIAAVTENILESVFASSVRFVLVFQPQGKKGRVGFVTNTSRQMKDLPGMLRHLADKVEKGEVF